MSYSWNLHFLRTYCHRVPHLPYNKPFFTFFNNNSSSSSPTFHLYYYRYSPFPPTFLQILEHPFFTLFSNLSLLFNKVVFSFSQTFLYLFYQPCITNLSSSILLSAATELSNYLSCIPFYLLQLSLLFILPTNPLIFFSRLLWWPNGYHFYFLHYFPTVQLTSYTLVNIHNW